MDKALNGLKKHVEWREEFHVDALLAGNTSSFAREMQQDKVLVTGHDKLGRPIMTILVRKHDKNNRNLEELRSYIIYTLESAMRRTKPEDEKLVLLFDLTKFGLGSMDYDAVKVRACMLPRWIGLALRGAHLTAASPLSSLLSIAFGQMIVNILQYNYPETLSVALIVGAPMLFSACWAIIKPWLDPVTAAKYVHPVSCLFVSSVVDMLRCLWPYPSSSDVSSSRPRNSATTSTRRRYPRRCAPLTVTPLFTTPLLLPRSPAPLTHTPTQPPTTA